jgi:hypothetical protein
MVSFSLFQTSTATTSLCIEKAAEHASIGKPIQVEGGHLRRKKSWPLRRPSVERAVQFVGTAEGIAVSDALCVIDKGIAPVHGPGQYPPTDV